MFAFFSLNPTYVFEGSFWLLVENSLYRSKMKRGKLLRRVMQEEMTVAQNSVAAVEAGAVMRSV